MEQETNQYHLLTFLLLAFTLVAILFSAENFKLNEQVRLEEESVEKIKIALENTPVLARAVSVYDITRDRKIYGKEDDIPVPLASLTKTMTVIVSLGAHKGNPLITISKDAINQAGDFGLFQYEKWRANDLAQFTLLSSANDGAFALTEGIENFLEKMNTQARKIGMTNTLFLSSTGLDFDFENSSGLISAEDANTMAIYALRLYPQIFGATALPEINLKSESGFSHHFKNTNTIVGKIPNLLFSKTGFTNVAGGNLTIIFKNKDGHDMAVTVLGSTFEGRFSDMENLVNTLYNI